MELEVLKQNIPNTYILRPSIISGDRNENRIGEKVGLVIFKLLQPLFIGKLKKYKTIKAKEIAQSMINLSNSKTSKEKIITSNKIREISKNNKLLKIK